MTDPNDYSAYMGMGHNRPDDLSEVARLAEAQHAAQQRVELLELQLKQAVEALKDISEKKLPAKMDELGLANYKTTTGITVEVSEKIRASLSVENRPKGFSWLENNKFGGMIKSTVVVPFPRDKLEDANKLVDKLRIEGKLANLERKVEASTLTAFVKEQLTQGKDIPLDVFGVFRQRVATVEVNG